MKTAEKNIDVFLPSQSQVIPMTLSPGTLKLRATALQNPCSREMSAVESRLSDARSWQQHKESEDWLLWRARLCAGRLRALVFDLAAGERIIGRPLLQSPDHRQQKALDAAAENLSSMPPFPGGDAGHFHPDYVKVFSLGITGVHREAATLRETANDDAKIVFYTACTIVLDAVIEFILRAGAACEERAQELPSEQQAWRQCAAICRNIAQGPPQTFHEAIQLLFMLQIALWFGEGHPLTSPGRLDQTLLPFYERDLENGRIAPAQAFELISQLFIHQNRILYPGSAVSVMVGGRDANGRDVNNDLTYLCLAAKQATGLVYPTVGLAWHRGTSAKVIDYSMDMLATGIADPAFFNDEVIVEGLLAHDVAPQDAFNYMNSTCVEIKVVGASNIWVTAPYFNLPQALLDVLRAAAANPEKKVVEDFAEFEFCLQARISREIKAAAEQLDEVWRKRAEYGCFPLASCFIADCLERGLDFDRGGARYNWVENSFVGLANLVDSVIAVKKLVYEQKLLTLPQLYAILQADFKNVASLRQEIENSFPHYGNQEQETDTAAQRWTSFLIRETERQQVGMHRYVPGFFCWIKHEELGRQTGATPDGRRAGQAFADGAGAAQGRERCGPTASVLSTTGWSHREAIGGLVHNVKFSREFMTTQQGRNAVRHVITTYLERGGFEIQVNVVGRETLLDAQQHPEHYPDLLVRVAGYSDYFVHLNRNMQNEVIDRTEFERG